MGKRLEAVYNTWTNLEASYKKKGNGKSRLDFVKALIPTSDGELSCNGIKSLLEAELPTFNSEDIEKYNKVISIVERAIDSINSGISQIKDLNTFLLEAENSYNANMENGNLIDLAELDIISKEIMNSGKEVLQAGYFSSVFSDKVTLNLSSMDKDLMYFRTKFNVMTLLINSEIYQVDANSFFAKVRDIIYKLLAEKESVENIAFISKDNFSLSDKGVKCYKKKFDLQTANKVIDTKFTYQNLLKQRVNTIVSYVEFPETDKHPKLIFVR